MKKFLTVLLALSVVFTYSFSAVGTVFADTATSEQEVNVVAAEKTAKAEAEANLNKAIAELDGVEQNGYVIEAAAYEQIKSDAWKAIVAAIESTTNSQLSNYTAGNLTGDALVKDLYYGGEDSNGCNIGVDGLKLMLTSEESWGFGVDAALAQFEIDYAAELTKFDSVDMSLYSTTVTEATSGKTYAELAQQYIQDAKDEIEGYVESEEANMTSVSMIKSVLNAVVARITAGASEDSRFPYLVMTKVGTTGIDSGLYALNPDADSYKNLKIKTNTDLENEGIISDAEAAATKAKIQQKYAEYLTDSTVATKDMELAKAYVTVLTWLADEGVIDTKTSFTSMQLATIKGISDTKAGALKAAVKNVEELNAFAEKYIAETDADGALVRDKAAVDKIVKEATTDLYAVAAGVVGYNPTYTTLYAAEKAIAEAIIANDAYKLDFAKKAAKAAFEADRADALENYYPLEQKDVNAAYDAALAKVDAAKTVAEVNAVTVSLAKIKTSADVDAMFEEGGSLVEPFMAQYEKLVNKVTYLNTNLSENRDSAWIYTYGLADAMVEFYGEKGARTKAEMEALATEIEALIDELPTVGGIAAAKAGAEAAIELIPAKVTAADADTVINAWNTANDYADLLNADDYTDLQVKLANKAKLDAAIPALHSAMALDLAKKVTAVDKNNKDALKAVQAEIDAFNDLCENDEIFAGRNKFTDTTVEKALDAIKAKELSAVKAAIDAIPINVTEADQAVVENARALYDAYVAEYTSYDPVYDAVEAIGYDKLRLLTIAETRIANIVADKKIKAVESLKIKASSSAKKGSITVKWTVTGDASAADGFQVYKSTKAQKGYTFMGKTQKTSMVNKKNLKKGTRYYYKVRAYVDIDGVRYYSDWSNKANRIAK